MHLNLKQYVSYEISLSYTEYCSPPINNVLWEELIAHFPLILQGPQRKQAFQQCLVAAGTCLRSRCIATLGKTDPYAPLIRHGPHRKPRVRLMGRIYEVRRSYRLRCHDIYTKFHKDWFIHAE
jgi:hypothetical protein